MLNFLTIQLDGTDLFFIILTIVLILGTCLLYFRKPAAADPLAKPGIPWRKLAPYLAFLGLGVLFVVLRPVVHNLLVAAYGGASAPGALNADGAEIAADQIAGGYVQLGNATSKIVMMLAIYALFSFVPWVFQQLTHPGPTAWKKDSYTADFDALPIQTKFEVDGRLGLNAAIRVLAAVVGACLIQ